MDTVGICNAALDTLAVDEITSLDDTSDEAQQCKAKFDGVRDAVLGSGTPWRFATQRFQLAADATPPIFGFSYRYPLDATVVQVLEVYPDASAAQDRHPMEEWEREGQWVLCNHASPIFIKAIVQVADVSLWPAGFCRCVEMRLAAMMCRHLTEHDPDDLWKQYGILLKEATANDGLQASAASYVAPVLRKIREWRR